MSYIQPVNIYTMKYTGALDFTFPNIPTLGNSMIYVFSYQGQDVVTTFAQYNHGSDGSGTDDAIFPIFPSGIYISPAGSGGNGCTLDMQWTQCVQHTPFTSVQLNALDSGGLGSPVVTYLTIYEVPGLISQVPGNPTEHNSNPSFDWESDRNTGTVKVVTAAGLTVLGDHMLLDPGIDDCSCPPPTNCGTNDRQAKFTIQNSKDVIIGQCAIPHCNFFNDCDPCSTGYTFSDFVFTVCGTGTANALTLTDNIQGTWIIDYQIDGQIFGHAGAVSTNAPIYKVSSLKTSDDHVSSGTISTEAINSAYFTYGFVNSSKASQNPLLGFHRKRYSEVQFLLSGSGNAQITCYPNYILQQSLAFNPYLYQVPPIPLQVNPIDDYVRPLNVVGNRVFVEVSTNAVGAAFKLSKLIMVGAMDSLTTVNPNAI